jgi:cytochrome c oxidase subunit 2
VYVLVRFRSGRNPKASYVGEKSKSSKYLEVAVALIEGVLLIGFSIPAWAQRVDRLPRESQSTVVRVIGQQFAWNIWYPGADGVFGKADIALVDEETNPLGLDRNDPPAADDITLINQLHLPVGKPAIIHISSKDVIHSFNLPHMRIKQDAIPGLRIPVWFEPTVTTAEMRLRLGNETFNYEIACAQLCGNSHYSMRGFLTIDTPEEYAAWMAEEASKLQKSGDEWAE